MPLPPLTGLKVIDLTRVLAGPFCTMLLGDLGADVIKIEEPGTGDEGRSWGPFVQGQSTFFLGLNRSKRGITLDLKQPQGTAALRRLLSDADVLVENFRPGSLDRLGFGVAAVRQLNPRLVYCSISGYGHTGPHRHRTGYDPIVQAESGFMHITGAADGPPTRTGIAMTDYLAGLYAFGGILAALRGRDRTGEGQHVDIALYDAVLSTLAMPLGVLETGVEPHRLGNDHSTIAPFALFTAGDGDVMVAAPNDRLWRQLCAAIDAPALAEDPRFATNTDRVAHRGEMKRLLDGAFARFTVHDLLTRLESVGVPAGRVRTVSEGLADPQVEARQMLIPFDGENYPGLRVLGNPIKLSDTPADTSKPAPRLGEHNRDILPQ